MAFKKKLLSSSIAAALIGVPMQAVIAQDDTEAEGNQVVEEVVVTGIRASLKAAMDIKRDSAGVVEAITAEDIGKFPDTNLAESLQRVTGVSIDRARGEGAKVTVRGFGPNFNLVTLNGRQMPTSSTDNDFGRSFDFGNLASEAVSAVEIYKSGKASVPTGGIGSTINIKTTKPLEAPGLKATFGAKGVYDTSVGRRGDKMTPEFSALVSNTFADDTFGVSLSLIRQERDNGFNTASIGGWRSFGGDQGGWGAIPDNDDQVNRPGDSDLYSVPQSVGYELAEWQRVRTNGQLTFQWDPTDTVRATLDYTYAEVDLKRTYNNYSAWYNFGGQQTVWTDGPNASPLTYAEDTTNNYADYANGAGSDAALTEVDSIGFNVEWDVSDRLKLAFDYHDSTSESRPNSPLGSASNLGIASFNRAYTATHFGQDLPILELGLSEPLNPDSFLVAGSVFTNNQSKMDIEQSRVYGTWDFDAGMIESLDFGIELTEVNNRAQSAVVQRDAWGGVTQPGAISDLLTQVSSAGEFSSVPGGNDPRLLQDYFLFDIEEIIARTEQLMASGEATTFQVADMGDCGTGLCATSNPQVDRLTQEESVAAYVQLNMSTEWGDMPVFMNAGVRYEQTDVASQALAPSYTQIDWVAANEFTAVQGAQDYSELTGDYSFVLPNFDFNISLTDDLVARASISKTLTRPNYDKIQGGQTITQLVRVDGGEGSRGNPALLPYESLNYDLSVEWYYDEASYLSVGYFRKNVENYLAVTEVTEPLFNLPHVPNGALYDEAVAAVGASGDIFNYILDNFPDAEGVDAVNRRITGIAGRDAPADFRVTIPFNSDEHTIDGWEVALQHNIGETGFGFIVNATVVSGDVEYDNLLNEQQDDVLPGLSDSYNVIGFYDKDGVQIRLAYNWRDHFLAGIGQNNVGAVPPTYVSEYGQWDVNASYEYNDNLTLFVEAINLTDETTHVYGRTELQTLFAGQGGPRYNIGMRYTF